MHKIIKNSLKIIFAIFLWLLISEFPIGMTALKDGGLYKIDEHYWLGGGAGSLFLDYEGKIERPISKNIGGHVSKYAIINQYLIEQT